MKTIRELYKQRWGIEVEFCGLKQTLDKGTLRCRTAARAKVELHWSLMAMAVSELFALEEQLPKPHASSASLPFDASSLSDADPQNRSLAETVRALRWSLTHLNESPESDKESLPIKLRNAKTDDYERKSGKAARYRRSNPDKKPLGEPKIRLLNAAEKKKLKELKQNALTG